MPNTIFGWPALLTVGFGFIVFFNSFMSFLPTISVISGISSSLIGSIVSGLSSFSDSFLRLFSILSLTFWRPFSSAWSLALACGFSSYSDSFKIFFSIGSSYFDRSSFDSLALLTLSSNISPIVYSSSLSASSSSSPFNGSSASSKSILLASFSSWLSVAIFLSTDLGFWSIFVTSFLAKLGTTGL